MLTKSRFLIEIIAMVMLIFVFSGYLYAGDGLVLMMATTTSTDNTGLLDYLAPKFTAETGVELKWTATGTGKALKLGQGCDVDVLMVHAPPAEKQFVAHGYGSLRTQIMYNDFVIIGPAGDPAKLKGKSIGDALKRIQSTQTYFISRGDNSGTHKKEKSLWESAQLQLPEKQKWYIQTGQGMLATINIANERQGYTMTDRGTYIKYADNFGGNPPLEVLVEGDKALLNQYSVIAIDPKHCSNANIKLAQTFIDWISAKNAQELIRNFKLLGKPLFTPNVK